MNTILQPRQSGKTRKIASDINWCCLFDLVPVAAVFSTFRMVNRFKADYLVEYKFTGEEWDNIHLFVGARDRASYAANTIYVINRLKYIKPTRIYIDEVQDMFGPFITELCSYFDDKIIAYGTK